MGSGTTPLYHRVFAALRARITAGEYPVGSQMPTEGALMEAFGAGRQTIRTAMDLLEREGLVQRFAGRGTFVQNRGGSQSRWTLDSIEDLIESSRARHYEILRAAMVPARSAPNLLTLFGVTASERLFFVKALRSSEQGPYAYSRIHLPRALGEKLPRGLLHTRPLLLLAEDHAGAVAMEARQITSSAPAQAEAARLLDVPLGTSLLVMERTYFDESGRPITHSLVQARPDRYEQIITFRRRSEPVSVARRAGRAAAVSMEAAV